VNPQFEWTGGGLAATVAELVRERATRGARGPLETAAAREEDARSVRGALVASAGAVVRGGTASRASGARALAEDVGRALAALPEARPERPEELAPIVALAEATKGKRLGKSDEALREAKEALVLAARELVLLEAERLAAPQKAELAALAGHPGAQRAVGTFCAHNPFAFLLPCHRVVGSNGIGGYGSAGIAVKRRLLALEGVTELAA